MQKKTEALKNLKRKKVERFLRLSGKTIPGQIDLSSGEERALGARLLLSETLEYVIHGLGITPVVNGEPIVDPDALQYEINGQEPNTLDALDGLADVAYTMFWNAVRFGLPLEDAYDLVCENNLSKFVPLENWSDSPGELPRDRWDCDQDIEWPESVTRVDALVVDGQFFAVGRDSGGKVRKPSNYRQVNLTRLVANS